MDENSILSAPAGAEPGTAREKPVVMVVDDTPSNIDLLVDILGEAHEVRVALDGPSALEDIADEIPDLLLLDVMMPGMDGYEVCRRLKADPKTRNIPVIFVTAKQEVTDEIKGFECGAVDYITKPVTAPVVRARVAAHLALVRQNRILKENVRLREEVDRIGRHDLKTPLNRIISLPRILLAAENLPSEHRQTIESIEEAGYTMLAMINRSLDIFKMENGTYDFVPEPVDLLGIVRKIASDLAGVAREKGCELDIRVTDSSQGNSDGLFVSGDPLLCYSLAANLIKNALEASPEKAGVQIRLGRESPDTAVFSVHNSGAVPVSVRDRFFDKYTTAGKRGGTGLGTYSAHLMARTMGGTIAMTTGAQQGTQVRVTLPWTSATKYSGSEASVPPVEAVSWQERKLPPLKVLIVDDDRDNLNILHRFLDHPALTIHRAEDGRQAVEIWRQTRHDIIFMDLEMPVTDGREALAMIRAEESLARAQRPVTVLALSAHGDEMAEDCLGAGFDGFMTKPVVPGALYDRMLKAAGSPGSDPGRPTDIPRESRIGGENFQNGKIREGETGDGVSDVAMVDRDLADIMPGFLENKRSQILETLDKIKAADGEGVRRNAHKLKGGFNMYGLSVLGAVCADLEAAATKGDEDQMAVLGQILIQRFDTLKIEYR